MLLKSLKKKKNEFTCGFAKGKKENKLTFKKKIMQQFTTVILMLLNKDLLSYHNKK